MARRMPSAAQAAAKWRNRMSSAGEDYKRGVDSVDQAPGELAAAAADRYAAGVAEAVETGHFAARSRSVSLQEWKTAAKEKGAARLASGAAASEAKTQRAMERNFANIETARNELPPRGGIEENLARAAQFARRLRELSRSGAGA